MGSALWCSYAASAVLLGVFGDVSGVGSPGAPSSAMFDGVG